MAQEKRINEHFELMVPSTLDDSNATYIRGVADSMKKFYFNDKPISKDTEQELSIVRRVTSKFKELYFFIHFKFKL